MSVSTKPQNSINFLFDQLLKHWRGEGQLWSAFWIITILSKVPLLLFGAGFSLFYAITDEPLSIAVRQNFTNIFTLIYTIHDILSWFVVWRCSPNVKHRVFSILAKTFAGVVILSYVLLIIGNVV